MPIVPRSDPLAQRISRGTVSPDRPHYQQTQATPENFGASYYRALAQLGGQVAQTGEELYRAAEVVRKRDNVLKAQELSLQLDSEFDEILNGEKGFYRAQGTNATEELGSTTQRKLQELVEKRAGQIRDPDVARRVRAYGLSSVGREIPRMGRHVATQSIKATADLTEARLNSATERAVIFRNSPEEFGDALQDGLDVIENNAALLGWSDEVKQQKVDEYTSVVVSKTIDSFAETLDVEGAEAFFRENRDGLSPTERDDVVAKIKSMERARSAEAARQRAEATAAREQYKRETGNAFFDKLAKNELTAADVMASDLPALGAGGKREWLQMIREGATGKQTTNPAVFNALFDRINRPAGDPQRITDPDEINPYLGAGLDYQSLKQLRSEINTKDTPEGRAVFELRKNLIRTARNTLSGSNDLLGIKDPEGDAKFQQWLSWFLDAEAKARKDSNYGPDFYTPGRPDLYLGRTIESFKRSDGDELEAQIEALDNPDAPAPTDIVDVQSPAEAAKLPKGTRFRTPDGRVMTRK